MSALFFYFLMSVCQARTLTSTPVTINLQSNAAPTSIATLQPGQWLRIPNSKMRAAVTTTGQGNVVNVIEAWSGGAYDSKRNRLMVWGGGHSDYSGSEIYAFDVPTLQWIRLSSPTGDPTSVHSYNHLQYLPKQDAFFAVGGATWPNGSATSATWLFNLSTSQWIKAPDAPGTAYSLWGYNMTTGYDPFSDSVLVAGYAQSAGFQASTKTWKLFNNADRSLYETGTFDFKRRKFLKFGGGQHRQFSVDTAGTMANEVTITTTGNKGLEGCTNPGLEYDSKSDRVVGWCSGGEVFTFNSDNNTWTVHAPRAGTGPAHPAGYTGTFGRFRYMPDYNAFIVVTSIDNDVFIYKLSDSNGVIP